MALYFGKQKVSGAMVVKISNESYGYVLATCPYGKKAIMLDNYHYETNLYGKTLIIGTED